MSSDLRRIQPIAACVNEPEVAFLHLQNGNVTNGSFGQVSKFAIIYRARKELDDHGVEW